MFDIVVCFFFDLLVIESLLFFHRYEHNHEKNIQSQRNQHTGSFVVVGFEESINAELDGIDNDSHEYIESHHTLYTEEVVDDDPHQHKYGER